MGSFGAITYRSPKYPGGWLSAGCNTWPFHAWTDHSRHGV